jgi:hypothetical protein
VPDGWRRISAEEDSENLNRVRYGSPEFQQAVARRSHLPIVVFHKYPSDHPGVNPTLKILFMPMQPFRTTADLLSAVLRISREGFPDFALVEPPTEVIVSGLPALHARVTYTMQIDGGALPTISEIWLVQRGDYVFSIGIGYSPDEPAATRAEFRAAVAGIVIADRN